jgi:butyryl-CoA dehydrogenase
MAAGILTCANLSLANYAFLTVANANMLRAFGTEDQRRRYLPPMLEGRWFGTMCLSEPQAGSSLADIATRAEPMPDGSFHLRGSKMWISGGDHELAENIVHMVLAKIPGGPLGSPSFSRPATGSSRTVRSAHGTISRSPASTIRWASAAQSIVCSISPKATTRSRR